MRARGIHRRFGLVVTLAAIGCTSPVEVSYSPGKETTDLPSRFRGQLADTLETLFGPVEAPRLDREASVESKPAEETHSAGTEHLLTGRAIYLRHCAACHGVGGDGQGPAAVYLDPPPRDYRRGLFKFTSTPFGAKPRRDDLLLVVYRGAKGTSMPAFRFMPKHEREAVVDYVKFLAIRGEVEFLLATEAASLDADDPESSIDAELARSTLQQVLGRWEQAESQLVLPATPRPAYDRQSIELGRAAFMQRECWKCHGKDGRGGRGMEDSQDVGKDAWGRTALAADLSSGMLHGGHRPIDVYRRIYSGINATPMPSFAQAFSDAPETIWHLTHFILSVRETGEFAAPAGPPAATNSTPAPATEP
jgi:mono/diheme cytochrome c family protein